VAKPTTTSLAQFVQSREKPGCSICRSPHREEIEAAQGVYGADLVSAWLLKEHETRVCATTIRKHWNIHK